MTHAEEDPGFVDCGSYIVWGPSLRKKYKITNRKLVKKSWKVPVQVKGPELNRH